MFIQGKKKQESHFTQNLDETQVYDLCITPEIGTEHACDIWRTLAEPELYAMDRFPVPFEEKDTLRGTLNNISNVYYSIRTVETRFRQKKFVLVLSSNAVTNTTVETNGRNPDYDRSADWVPHHYKDMVSLTRPDDPTSWAEVIDMKRMKLRGDTETWCVFFCFLCFFFLNQIF